MASQNVKVIVEFPAGLHKLNKQQTDSLKSIFRTQLANVLGAEGADRLADMDFENVTKGPGGGRFTKKPGSKKGVKGGAKKSSKKR
jgi:hypothetical protein